MKFKNKTYYIVLLLILFIIIIFFLKLYKCKTYYKIFGEIKSNTTPIILINGGPGFNCKYFEEFARNEKYLGPIIIYDQLGSGKTKTYYSNLEISLKKHVNQLIDLINDLNIKKCHLLGHSYGSIIALEAYFRIPNKITSIIFYSSAISVKLWQEQANNYVKEIVKDYYNKKIKTNLNKYIYNEYKNRYIVNKNINFEKYIENQNTYIYNKIWGETEYTVNGELKNYDKSEKIKEIYIPIYFISGEYDTASEYTISKLIQNRNIKYNIIKNSRHLAHIEQPNNFLKSISNFYYEINNKKLNDKFNKYLYFFNKNNNNLSIVDESIKLLIYYIFYKNDIKDKNNNIVFLNKSISNIKNKINYSTLNLNYLDIQAYLDFWYLTKLLNHADKFKPNISFLNFLENKVMNIEYHLENKNHRILMMLYIFIRTLEYCDYTKYKKYLKYIKSIEEITNEDTIAYGYYLTHVILYDCKFGKSNYISKSSIDAFSKLEKFCDKRLNYNSKNIDLIAEIILCCKLCNKYDFKFLVKLVNTIIENDKNINYKDYHLNAVLVCCSINYWN